MWIGILNTSVTVPSLPGQGNPGPPPPVGSKFASLETGLADIILLETSDGTNDKLLLETQT